MKLVAFALVSATAVGAGLAAQPVNADPIFQYRTGPVRSYRPAPPPVYIYRPAPRVYYAPSRSRVTCRITYSANRRVETCRERW